MIDLLFRLMRFSKHDRITAQQGLEHPYCAQVRELACQWTVAREVAAAHGPSCVMMPHAKAG